MLRRYHIGPLDDGPSVDGLADLAQLADLMDHAVGKITEAAEACSETDPPQMPWPPITEPHGPLSGCDKRLPGGKSTSMSRRLSSGSDRNPTTVHGVPSKPKAKAKTSFGSMPMGMAPAEAAVTLAQRAGSPRALPSPTQRNRVQFRKMGPPLPIAPEEPLCPFFEAGPTVAVSGQRPARDLRGSRRVVFLMAGPLTSSLPSTAPEAPKASRRPFAMTLRRPALLALLFAAAIAGLRAADNPAGLAVTFAAGGGTDLSVAENVWLHVPAGQPATPFLAPGPFTATWKGQVVAELRADFTFHAEFNGDLKLTVNDTVVLEGKGEGDKPVTGKSIRLNKGANNLVAEFKSPAAGDAFVRLFWSNKETPYNPIPLTELSHPETDDLKKALLVRRGRDLFAEARCAKCHTTPGGMPELAMDAPAFDGIGGRRNFDWLARWIEHPHARREFITNDLPGNPVTVLWHEDEIHSRETRPMPFLFLGADATAKAEAAAAFLASLKGPAPFAATKGDVEEGKALFEKLHCVACHDSPEHGRTMPHQITHRRLNAKFAPGALAAFLQKPQEHFAWIRMPDFRLSAKEAQNLAEFLMSVAEKAEITAAPTDAALIEKGRRLVTAVGCLNCHTLDGARSELVAKPLAELNADRWTSGCIADQRPAEANKTPFFNFNAAQKAALRAFAATDRASLTRHTSADFLARQSEHLNCRECHGKFEGFPAYQLLYGKLKPEWTAKFIAGTHPVKPRPWLESRMPNFPAYAEHLATGLATIAGLPAKTPADPAPADTSDLAKAGQKLVSANGGFACVSCHPVGEMGATQVFEAPGINLATSFDRIQPAYFRRWLRAPTSVDPSTKMPGYFDEEGKSPLPDVLGGDGPKTIGAVWEYIRLADKMPRPE